MLRMIAVAAIFAVCAFQVLGYGYKAAKDSAEIFVGLILLQLAAKGLVKLADWWRRQGGRSIR